MPSRRPRSPPGPRVLRGLLVLPVLAGLAAAPRTGALVLAAGEDVPILVGVEIEGEDAINERELADALAPHLTRGGPVRPGDLEAARAALETVCAEDGFLLAQVDLDIEPRVAGRIFVRFSIREGRRVAVDRVEIRRVGIAAEEPAGLGAAEITKLSGIVPERGLGILQRGSFRPHTLEAGLLAVRERYRDLGWLDAEVGLDELELDARKRYLTVRLLVDEGRRYRVSAVRITGNTLFPDALVREVLRIRPGEFHDRELIAREADRLVRWYEDRSDRIPAVRTRWIADDDAPTDAPTVTVVLEIDESVHRFVRRVDVRGNSTNRDRVIRSLSRVTPGEPLRLRDLDRTAERLRARGLFDDVRVEARGGETPSGETGEGEARDEDRSELDVRIEVDENDDLFRWELGGGASSGEGEIAYFLLEHKSFDLFRGPRSLTDWSDAFTGGGQRLKLELLPGSQVSEGFLTFQEPYLFRSDQSLTLRLGTVLFDYGSFDDDRLTASLEARRFLDDAERLSAAIEYRAERVRIHGFDRTTPPSILRDRGARVLSYPRISLRYGSLDQNPYSGPEGILAEAKLDLADAWTGSESAFTRTRLEADGFLRLFAEEDVDLAHRVQLGVELGWVGGRGDRLPFHEAFTSGGPRTLRGFEYRGVGPHEGRTAIGGGGLVGGTASYSLPLFFREARGVVLFDWGAVEDDFGDLSFGRLRTAAGVGLELRLPLLGQVVPVNLYWAHALSSEAGDRETVFTFTLGYGL